MAYPLVICYIAIENGHRNSGFTWIYPLKMVILHSYVSLPVYQRLMTGLFTGESNWMQLDW